MDLDLWIRIASRFQMRSIPHALANIRTSLDTKTSSVSERYWDELAIIGERYGLEAITPAYIRKERARKHFYRGMMLLQAGRMREARTEIREVIRLSADRSTTSKSVALYTLSLFGSAFARHILKWRMSVYNRRSDLRHP
jgi:hypothetical protein